MSIQKLIHVELSVNNLEAATRFHTDVMGLHILAQNESQVSFGCGLSETAVLTLIEGPATLRSFALGVDHTDDLTVIAQRLNSADHPCSHLDGLRNGYDQALTFALPGGQQAKLIVQNTPNLYLHPASRYAPRRAVAPLDIDHLTLAAPDENTMRVNVAFLSEHLGFRISDIVTDSDGRWRAAWTRTGELHHDVAFLTCRTSDHMHHLGWTFAGADHLKDAADALAANGIALEAGPGRHGVGGNLYAYFWTPFGHRYELSAEMPRLPGNRDTANIRSSQFNAFSAWGASRPDTWGEGS